MHTPPHHAVGQERGAGEGVRAPAGMADDGEAVDAEGVGDGGDVASRRRDGAAGLPRRAAVRRAVVADPPDAAPVGEEGIGWLADLRCAVVPDHGEGGFGAGVVHVQRPPVTQVDVRLPDHPSSVGAPPAQRGRTLPA